MKRRLVYILTLLLIVTHGALALSTDTDGYYLIGSAQDLKDFATLVNGGNTTANGKLIAPIDLQGSPSNQWTPIGTGTYPYNGTFDGQGFTISNLYYHQVVASAGLFGRAGSSARIKNVRVVVNIDNTGNGATAVSGATEAGGILGTGAEGTVIINCSVTGSVLSFSNVGGIVGTGSVTVVNCYNEATVKFFSSNGQTGGGIHGYGGSPALINCYNVGQIINTGSSTSHMGNIAISGTATNCYSLENCCQNGAGAAWSNQATNGIPGTTRTSSEIQAAAFTNTLYSNALNLRATYPNIDTWMQDPATNRPILKQSYKPTEGPWTRAGEKTGYYADSGDQSISWNSLNNSQWTGTVFPYVNNSNGLGTQMAGTASPCTKQTIYTLYSTTQTIPSYSVMVWNWSFQLKGHYEGLAQQTGLYAHTNLSTLKSTALDFTYNNETNAGSEICVGLVYHNAGYLGQDVSQNGNHNFWLDNRNGSTELAQPVYMIQTHIAMNSSADNAIFGPGWVSFKNVSSSYTYYYYKHVTFNANGGSGSMPVQTIENSGTLTVNTFTRSGYTFAGWNTSPDGSGTDYANQATITATSTDKGPLTLYAQWDFQGSGTEDDPYLISSEADWNLLADKVSIGYTYSGKFFRQTADINVITMVGNSDNPFSGTFDGDGHSIQITTNNKPLFGSVNGATIKNLVLTGSVEFSDSETGKGALIGTATGTTTVENCRVSTSVTYNKTTVLSGCIVGKNDGTLNISCCVFDGALTAPDEATEIGGIVYSPSSGDAKVRNCVFNPASVTGNITDYNCNFIRGNGTVHSNNYYFTTLSSTNAAWDGKQAHSITAGTDVTISNLGDGIKYNVSDITAYTHGIKYGSTFYAGNGDEVSLTLSHADAAEGYAFGGYEASSGTLIGSDNPYTLTMASDDVTISATWKKILTSANITIESVAYDGNSHTAVVKCGETNLIKGTDYTVDNGTDALTNVGSTTFTITGIGGYTGTVEKTFTIYRNFAFTNSDWMTWYGAEDLTVDAAKMETYVVTEVTSSTITTSSTNGEIYHNKPMLLKRKSSSTEEVHGNAPTSALSLPTDLKLSNAYIGGMSSFNGYTSGTVYVLAGSEFVRARVTESTTFSPSKCFIYITAYAGSRLHIVADGDATGMKAIDGATEEKWYTIGGRKLSKQPKQPGVYISNGNKVIVK